MAEPLLLSVVEMPPFMRQADKIWNEEEREAFVDHMARNPEAGDVVPGTGGVRKIRWARKGMGKRGGARVIYFYHHMDAPLYLIAAYAKAQQEDMSAEEKKVITALVGELKKRHPTGKD
jgi:hypothetical protein